MPSRNEIQILTRYHVAKRSGRKLQVRMKEKLPKLDGVSLLSLEDPGVSRTGIMLRVLGKNNKIGKMDAEKVIKKYISVPEVIRTKWKYEMYNPKHEMRIYDGEEMICDISELERTNSLFTTVELKDLHPLPSRPFGDECSLVSDILPLMLSCLPFKDIVKAQLVCRRFQFAIR